MNSVMNFLAEYYIWFFVTALLLSFALIGFIIDTKKKQKSEFKGESIETPKEEVTPTVENNTTTLESINPTPVSEETMEINDIPLKETTTENISIGEPISTESTPSIDELNIHEVPEYPLNNNEEVELESLDFDDVDNNKNV